MTDELTPPSTRAIHPLRGRIGPLFRTHLAWWVEREGSVPVAALLEWSSLALRCKPRTLRDYLNAECSSAGRYEYVTHSRKGALAPHGGRFVRYKAVDHAR